MSTDALPLIASNGGFWPGSDAWKGTTWTGSAQERDVMARDFDDAAAWAAKNGWPLDVGEFLSYQEADIASRVRWTRGAVNEAQKHRFSWEFCVVFGAYDPIALAWREPCCGW